VTAGPDEAPTLGEIARSIYRIDTTLREMRGEHLRADVYAVAHKALQDKVEELAREVEATQAARAAYQRMAVGALITAAGSLLVQFVITVLSNKP
jgi:hypothetical protein